MAESGLRRVGLVSIGQIGIYRFGTGPYHLHEDSQKNLLRILVMKFLKFNKMIKYCTFDYLFWTLCIKSFALLYPLEYLRIEFL